MLALKNSMVKFYNSKAYTHEYIFGVVYNHKVYIIHANSKVLCQVLKLDRASRGNGYALRFRPNRAVRELLISMGAEVLCSAEYFNELCKASKYNKGEVFERLVTEYYGQHWEKDSVPFTDDGDLTVDGIAYQIKFEGASFINEKQIERLRAA